MYHLNSTLHMWNFIPKFDILLVYLWLLLRLGNNVHSLESFSLVDSFGIRLMSYFMQVRWLKQIHGDMSHKDLSFNGNQQWVSTFIHIVLEANILFRG